MIHESDLLEGRVRLEDPRFPVFWHLVFRHDSESLTLHQSSSSAVSAEPPLGKRLDSFLESSRSCGALRVEYNGADHSATHAAGRHPPANRQRELPGV
jgi:hypothetical protein